MVAFGLRFLAEKFPNDERAQSWSRMRQRDLYNISSQDVHTVFQRARQPLDCLLDCRGFTDPDKNRNLREHVGSHPEIMQGIIRGRVLFRRILETLFNALKVISGGSSSSSSSSSGRVVEW